MLQTQTVAQPHPRDDHHGADPTKRVSIIADDPPVSSSQVAQQQQRSGIPRPIGGVLKQQPKKVAAAAPISPPAPGLSNSTRMDSMAGGPKQRNAHHLHHHEQLHALSRSASTATPPTLLAAASRVHSWTPAALHTLAMTADRVIPGGGNGKSGFASYNASVGGGAAGQALCATFDVPSHALRGGTRSSGGEGERRITRSPTNMSTDAQHGGMGRSNTGAGAAAGRSSAPDSVLVAPTPRLLINTPQAEAGAAGTTTTNNSKTNSQSSGYASVLTLRGRGARGPRPKPYAPVPASAPVAPPALRPTTPPTPGPLERDPRKIQFPGQWLPHDVLASPCASTPSIAPLSSSPAPFSPFAPLPPPPAMQHQLFGKGGGTGRSPSPDRCPPSPAHSLFRSNGGGVTTPRPPPSVIPMCTGRVDPPTRLGGLGINRTTPEFLERLARVKRARSYGDRLRAAVMMVGGTTSSSGSTPTGDVMTPTKRNASSTATATTMLPMLVGGGAAATIREAEDAKARRRKMQEYAAAVPKPRLPVLPPLSASSTGSVTSAARRHVNNNNNSGARWHDESHTGGNGEGVSELEALEAQYARDAPAFEQIKAGLGRSRIPKPRGGGSRGGVQC